MRHLPQTARKGNFDLQTILASKEKKRETIGRELNKEKGEQKSKERDR